MKDMLKRITAIVLAMMLLSGDICAIAESVATLMLPKALQIIDEEAFYGNTSIEKVVVPDGTTEIRNRAFANSSLTELVLPDSLTFIAEDAFEGCGEFVLTVPENCYAFNWCVEHGYITVEVPATPAPTVAPTATPTLTPTAIPTATPTLTPTPEPTATPTVTPTATPTPTPEPTNDPAKFGAGVACSAENAFVGQSVTWIATAINGLAPYKYLYKLYRNEQMIDTSAYSDDPTYTYCFAETGDYYVILNIKDDNREVVSVQSDIITVGLERLMVSNVACDLVTIQTTDTATWTATATGGQAPYAFAFSLTKDGETVAERAYSEETAFCYEFVDEGDYTLAIKVKDDLGAESEAYELSVSVALRPVEIASVTANVSACQTEDAITWTVEAIAGKAPYTYAFEIIVDGVSQGKSEEQEEGTYNYTPELAGTYKVIAYVTDTYGNVAQRESSELAVTTKPLAVLNVVADKDWVKVGDTVTWTTTAVGGVKPLRYAFDVYVDGEELDGCAFTTNNTISYAPEMAGVYSVNALVRDAENTTVSVVGGEVTAYEHIALNDITPDVTESQTGEAVNWIVEKVGGTGTIIYDYEVYWEETLEFVSRLTSPKLTYAPMREGIYTVKVIATDAGGDVGEIIGGMLEVSLHGSSPQEDFTYTVLNGTYCTVTGYTGSDTAVVIPEMLDEYIVQKIGNSMFKNNTTIRSVVIPDTVETMGSEVFYGCTNLLSVIGGKKLTNIGSYAFYNCTSLINYDFAESTVNLGSYAFRGCTALTSFCGWNGLQSIGSNAFENLKTLTQLELVGTITSIGSEAFYGCSGLTSVKLPENLTYLGKYAFRSCTSLQSIHLPDSITEMGYSVFSSCGKLTEANYPTSWKIASSNGSPFSGSAIQTMVVPEGVATLPAHAFDGCSSLRSITLPSTLISIGSNAFESCSGLTSIEIPDSVTTISSETFYGCSGLMSVKLPENLTYLGKYAFRSCTSLQSIHLPDSITEMGYSVFSSCGKLTEANYPTSWKIASSDGSPFSGSAIQTMVVPEGVTKLPDHAFDGCSSLRSVTLPSTLTSIGYNAFESCSGLTSIEIPDSVTTISSETFYGCSGLMSVVIPAGVVSINSYAFRSCTKLAAISIPESVTSIATNAFSSCPNIAIYGLTGSYAETYALENGFAFNPAPIPEVSLTVEATGDTAGSKLNATAVGTNGTAPYTYSFSLYKDGERIRQTPYSSSKEYSFNIFEAGTYQVTVTVKDHIGQTGDAYSGSYIINEAEQPVSCFVLHGEVYVGDIPLDNTYVYAVSQTDQSVVSTYTTSEGKWDLYNLRITDTYELKYYKDGYSIPGAGTVAVADADRHLTAKGSLVIDSEVMLQAPTFTMSTTEMVVGESITLVVNAPKAERVRLIVDGNAYEWYAVTNGVCTIERRFTKAGARQVQIQTGSMNSWGSVSKAQLLVITSAGTLSAPMLSTQATASIGNEYSIKWDAVDNATDYQLYLYCNGRRILPQYGKELTRITSTSYTIPGEYIACPGEYAIELIASGNNYSQCSGLSEFKVANQAGNASLCGEVVDTDSNEPIGGVEVSVYQIVGDHYDYITSCETNSLGYWEVNDLYAGTRYYYVLGKAGYIIDYEDDFVLMAGVNTVDTVKAVAIGDGPLYTYDSLVEANNEYSEHFLTIYSPGEWTASTTADWIILSGDGSHTVTQAADEQTLSVYVAPNESEERQDIINVVCDSYSIDIVVSQHANTNITAYMLRGFKTTKNGTPVLSQSEAKDLLNFLAGRDVVTKGGFLWLFYKVEDGYDNYWNVITGNGKYSDGEEALYRQAFIQYAFMQVSAIANYEATDNELYRRALQYSLNYINDEYGDANDAFHDEVRDIVIDETLDAMNIDTLPDAEDAAFFVSAATTNKIRAWINSGRYMVKNWNAFDSLVSWSDEMILDAYLTTYQDSGLYPSKSKVNKWIEYLETLDSVD